MSQLEEQLMAQYKELTDDIKAYYDKQEAEFRSKSNIVPEDRINYLIDNKISNLEEQRKIIWNRLQDEFNQNTKDKHTNAKIISRNKKILCKLNDDLKTKQSELKELQDQNQTSFRHVEGYLYHNKSTENVVYVMMISSIILSINLIILILTYFGFIESFIGTIMFWISMIIIISFAVYQIYISQHNKSHLDYDKYIYPSPIITDSKISTKQNNIDYESVDKKIDKELDKYTKNTNNKCNVSNTKS
jgi:hypothetical protein